MAVLPNGKRLQVGDIIFIHYNSPQSLFVSLRFWSWWNHFAIYIGNNRTAEITDKGFRNLNFDKRYKNKSIAIFRSTLFDKAYIKKIPKFCRAWKDEKLDILRIIFPIIKKRKRNWLCSEFVDRVVLGEITSVWKLEKGNYKSVKKIYDYRDYK